MSAAVAGAAGATKPGPNLVWLSGPVIVRAEDPDGWVDLDAVLAREAASDE